MASSGIYCGIGVAVFNNYFEEFSTKVFKISDEERQKEIDSNLSFFFYLGALFTGLTGHFIYNYIGRFKTLILAMIINVHNEMNP